MYSCQRCGKGSIIGSNSAHKHSGAWAMRAPKSRKIWRPNLHRIRIELNNKPGIYWLCTKCQRTLKKLVSEKNQRRPLPEPAADKAVATA